MTLKTPLLFLVYNRTEITSRVFSQIKKVKPCYLYIAADGPKNNEDKINCDKTKSIFNDIDWECDVHRLYRDNNLGCKDSVKGAIDWFFENVEEGIILEDDCWPDITAFEFLQVLLGRYRNHNKVQHINASNYQKGIKRGDSSYYYSAIPNINGWATWRESWAQYDKLNNYFNIFKESRKIEAIFKERLAQKYWLEAFESSFSGNDTSWSTPYIFSFFFNDSLSVTPNNNLISNIGYGRNSVHTKNSNDPSANIPTVPMKFPLESPLIINADRIADKTTNKLFYKATYLNYGLKKLLKRLGLFNPIKRIYIYFFH